MLFDNGKIKKKKSVHKHVYTDAEIEQILDSDMVRLAKLAVTPVDDPWRAQHKKESFLERLREAKLNCPALEKPQTVKTNLLDVVVLPEMVGCIVGIYNGPSYIEVEIRAEMVGHQLREFAKAFTRPVKQGRLRIGTTHRPLKRREKKAEEL